MVQLYAALLNDYLSEVDNIKSSWLFQIMFCCNGWMLTGCPEDAAQQLNCRCKLLACPASQLNVPAR